VANGGADQQRRCVPEQAKDGARAWRGRGPRLRNKSPRNLTGELGLGDERRREELERQGRGRFANGEGQGCGEEDEKPSPPLNKEGVSGPKTAQPALLRLVGCHVAPRYTRRWRLPHEGPHGSGTVH
jgi:hypothetical protein